MKIHPIKYKGIPIYLSFIVEKAGGSIIKPLPFIHKIYPLVDPDGSNPWLEPNKVKPNAGGLNVVLIGISETIISESLFIWLYSKMWGLLNKPYYLYSFFSSPINLIAGLSFSFISYLP